MSVHAGDLEAGLNRTTGNGVAMVGMSVLPGKWEALFVWMMSFFFSFWIHVRPPC